MSTLIRRILDRAVLGSQPPALVPIPQAPRARHRGGRHPEDWPAPGTSTGGVFPRELATDMEAVASREALR